MELPYSLATDEIVIFKPFGRMDMSNANEFEKCMFDVIQDKQLNIIIDISKVEYISSSYIGILLSLQKRMNAEKRRLIVCSPSEFCRRVFDIVQIDNIIDIYTNVDDAIMNIVARTHR